MMVDPAIQQEIERQLKQMPLDGQRQVLDFARSLAQSGPKGEAGKDLLRFAGFLDALSIREMTEAIESGCERVDVDAW
jgi:hypothetical protein